MHAICCPGVWKYQNFILNLGQVNDHIYMSYDNFTCLKKILLVSKIKELRLALILLILYIYSLKALKPDLNQLKTV